MKYNNENKMKPEEIKYSVYDPLAQIFYNLYVQDNLRKKASELSTSDLSMKFFSNTCTQEETKELQLRFSERGYQEKIRQIVVL